MVVEPASLESSRKPFLNGGIWGEYTALHRRETEKQEIQSTEERYMDEFSVTKRSHVIIASSPQAPKTPASQPSNHPFEMKRL